MIFVGLISYPLYLWHWPLLSFAQLTIPDSHSYGVRGGLVMLAVVLAALTYIFVEIPVRHGKRASLQAVSAFTILLCVGMLGLLSFYQKGFSIRWPEKVRDIASYSYDYISDARVGAGGCWLGAAQAFEDFGAACSGSVGTPGATDRVIVWGDSHAGRLYPGLKLVINWTDVGQYAKDSCPPLLKFVYEKCAGSNAKVLAVLERHAPETVILFAAWNKYGEGYDSNSPVALHLIELINRLKGAGVKNILVLGPAPQWKDNLPKLILADLRRHISSNYMSDGLEQTARQVDRNLKRLLDGSEATYVSLIDLMCNRQGCLTRVSSDPTSFVTWDYGHFTTQGAKYVAQRLTLQPSTGF